MRLPSVPERVKRMGGVLGAAFVIAAVAEYKGLGVGVLDLDGHALKALANAGIDAVVVTAASWLAPFVDHFGVGAKPPDELG